MTISEAINKCDNFLQNGGELDKEALAEVVNYADSCYVDHCEEVGKIAIENIEELQKDIIDGIIDWLEWYADRHKSEDNLTPMITALKNIWIIKNNFVYLQKLENENIRNFSRRFC